MISVTMRAVGVLGLLISVGGLSGCANVSSGGHARAPALERHSVAAVPSAHAGEPAAEVCDTTQRDLTAAMNDLQITDFSGWTLSFTTGDVVGGATITKDLGRLKAAFKVTAALMNSFGSSANPVASTVGDDLSDTGGDFEDLISGDGTVSDEAVIVHSFSAAVAATVALCGPDSFTRYAPAQEAAMDDLAGIDDDDYSSDLNSLASIISQTRADLSREENLAALGPQGDGGSCTVAEQMGQAAQEIAQGDGGNFSQYLAGFTVFVTMTRQNLSRTQADLSTIASQRLTLPANANAAIATAEQAISQAIARANQLIDTENGLMSESFSLANSLAEIPSTSTANESYSGSCAGYGPGNVSPFLVRNIT
jgi:hypothetical protein